MLRASCLWTSLILLSASQARGEQPVLTPFDSPQAALSSLLTQKPRVIAFGEYHEVEGGPKARSALRHFLDELWPLVAPIASDLLVETWVTEGHCGKEEKKTVAKVEETTKRPQATEDEIVTLLERAKAAGVAPHILTLSCLEYLMITKGTDEIDYVRLLRTITEHLRDDLADLLAERRRSPKAIVVYGGALHGELHPRRELRDYSFATEIDRKVHRRFLEVGLYVPEYIEGNEEVTAEPWFGQWSKSDQSRTWLVKRGPRSYAIVFARTPK